MKINLNSITDINCFVKGIAYYEGDIVVTQGRHVVNGRSFLGLHSLNLVEPIEVIIHSDRTDVEENFYNFIKKWEIEK